MSDARERELVPLTEREAAEIQGGEAMQSIIICCPYPFPFPFPFPDPFPLPWPIPTGPWL